MDTSGNIRNLVQNEQPKDNELLLTEEEAAELRKYTLSKRKNWMRNKPCRCGSGKKFKKCCWSKIAILNHQNN